MKEYKWRCDFWLNWNECDSSIKPFTTWIIQYCNVVVYIFFLFWLLSSRVTTVNHPHILVSSFLIATNVMSSLITPIYLVLGVPLSLLGCSSVWSPGLYLQNTSLWCPNHFWSNHLCYSRRTPQHLHLCCLQVCLVASSQEYFHTAHWAIFYICSNHRSHIFVTCIQQSPFLWTVDSN